MKQFFTALLIILVSTPFFAQEKGMCGFVPTLETQKKLALNRMAVDNQNYSTTEDIIYIPIRFHLVANLDGEGRVRERDVLKQLCVLNEDYANTQFRFYIKDGSFNYYNSNLLYENPHNSTSHMNNIKVNDAINVFIINEIGTGQGGLGTVLGYFDPAYDWIVIKKSEVQSGTNTLSHELGHFFSLAHTFNGWEGAPFQSSSAGWPIAPVTSPGGVATENQDGSNCSNAGDKVCDTPPDYNFGIIWSNCTYTGGAKDPNEATVDPDEHNQMCYFNGCYPYHFSNDQIALMLAEYNSKTYIQSSYVPNTNQPTDQVTLTYPEYDATSITPTGLVLDWDDVADAQYYVVEVSRTTNFSLYNITALVSESQYAIEALTGDVKYFWKVTPYTENGTCIAGLTSDKFKFRTAPVSISEINEIKGWNVAPNPVVDQITLSIDADKKLDLTAEVMTLDGKNILTQNVMVYPGNQIIDLPNLDLSNGTYFVRLISNEGMETKKIQVYK